MDSYYAPYQEKQIPIKAIANIGKELLTNPMRPNDVATVADIKDLMLQYNDNGLAASFGGSKNTYGQYKPTTIRGDVSYTPEQHKALTMKLGGDRTIDNFGGRNTGLQGGLAYALGDGHKIAAAYNQMTGNRMPKEYNAKINYTYNW